MPVHFNHLAVAATDKHRSATFLKDLLGLAEPTSWGPFLSLTLDDGVAVSVRGEPPETRRTELARLPGPLDGATAHVADAILGAVSRALPTAPASVTPARRARSPAPPARR